MDPHRFALALCLLPSLAACTGTPTGSQPAGTQPVTLRFAAMVGDQAFACSQADKTTPMTYSGIGTTASTITPTDFRFYVSDVALLDVSGKATPVTLKQDGKWQYQNVALLDFEDKTGLAVNGTTDTNAAVTGAVPEGAYTGLRFTVGVPETLNHADASKAASPLNLTGLFWSWQGGYKHARIDFTSKGLTGGYNIHLGSTGCTGTMMAMQTDHGGMAMPMTNVTCTANHRPTITLTAFDPGKDVVVADLKALLSETNVDVDQGGAAGCMSAPDDPDCGAIFNAFGLPSGGSTVPAQRFFRVKSAT